MQTVCGAMFQSRQGVAGENAEESDKGDQAYSLYQWKETEATGPAHPEVQKNMGHEHVVQNPHK